MAKAISGKGNSMCKGKEGRPNVACLENCKPLILLEHRQAGREKPETRRQ